ncbi:uncharacterized protein LOC118766035 [Octopus sinensis]|uniref:Uncharacterized protein LOC118766035 n=1 Tax=Octopus sinensis TaxID=2607531 RepID=A0A7E6FCJ2_9MOLL|nr:uncharacterized protein LOC118766035 [Octopus sinensis]
MNTLSLFIILIIGVTPSAGDAVYSPSIVQICYYKVMGKSPNDAVLSLNTYSMQQFKVFCGSYPKYVNCLTRGISKSDEEQDMFLNLLYQNDSMHISYAGICHDVDDLMRGIKCLEITNELKKCYHDFATAIGQMMEKFETPLPNHPISKELKDVACNITVARYRCELALYRRCNRRVGQIMSNFLYGALPTRCQTRMSVRSEYTALYGSSNISRVTSPWLVVFLCVLLTLQ